MKQGWEIKKIGEVCCKKQQIARATKKYTPSDNIAYIDISAIDSATNEIMEPTILRFQDAPSRAQQVVEKDDILVSLVRPNLKNIAQVNESREDLVASSGFCVLRTKENPRYIRYVVLGERFTNYLISRTSGANYPAVREEDIKEYPIPIPPLPEQEKIVSELDCLSGLIEKKRQQLKELDALAQSIFYEMFGNPVENERGWEVKKLGEVCCRITDGTHDTPERLSIGVKFITGKHIKPGIIEYDNSEFVSEDVHKEIYARCNPEYGDVLYTNIGANLGTAAINKVFYEFSMKNVALLKLNGSKINGYYAQSFLNNNDVRDEIIKTLSSGGAQKFLSLKAIGNIIIGIPPLPLQQTLAQKVEAIEKQKELIKQSIIEAETLLASRMQYYFEEG